MLKFWFECEKRKQADRRRLQPAVGRRVRAFCSLFFPNGDLNPPRRAGEAVNQEPVREKLKYQLQYFGVLGLRVRRLETCPCPAPEPSCGGAAEEEAG